MNTTTFAVLLLVASAAAYSTSGIKDERRDVVGVVVNAVENIIARIQNRGLDPYEIGRVEGEYVLFHPSLFSASGYVENLRFTGLSNIVIVDLHYSTLTSTLSYEFLMPQIMLTVGDAGGKVTAAGRDVEGKVSGLLAINNFGVSGRAQVSYDSPITITAFDVSARLASIESNLTVQVMGLDVSIFVNGWLTALPQNLKMYEDLINRGLTRLIEFLINRRFD